MESDYRSAVAQKLLLQGLQNNPWRVISLLYYSLRRLSKFYVELNTTLLLDFIAAITPPTAMQIGNHDIQQH